MKPDITWLDNPEVFRVGQLPAHSDHSYTIKGKASAVCLNGQWDFAYSKCAGERPVEFYREDFDRSGWDKITVPGHIELAGYDKIHYINVMYPWEGMYYRRPAGFVSEKYTKGQFSEADYNPVGSYVTGFDLPEHFQGKRVCISFEGVEQAMYLWINGQFVGYAEDSFTPSEFDLTPYVRKEGNLLAVEVHKRSTAAYLEDQDFFRFFGIFRDVKLYAKGDVHVEDLWVKPVFNADNKTGSLTVDVKLSVADNHPLEEMQLNYALKDKEGAVVFCGMRKCEEKFTFSPDTGFEVIPWDNYSPYLYDLEITLQDSDGNEIECIHQPVGFRRIEIKNKVMLLNGQRLRIVGVNRHEWNCRTGRCITIEDMKWDMELFKENNINAVRTCHYPDQIAWYGLCDENGIYCMSETNLETHGSWQKYGCNDPSWNLPGDFPEWKEAVLDRARTNFETFKNHPSVLFWSLGNESFAGENLVVLHEFFQKVDPSRPVHYEGVANNRVYEDRISDMESRMYAEPWEIEEYLSNNPKKPYVLCEYMHDMGNSIGGMKSYMDLFDKYEMFQGGFIWDYIDQAIMVFDEITGEEVLRYGGDFDDRPCDYEFSGNGIVFADRTPKPALQEVKYYYGLYK